MSAAVDQAQAEIDVGNGYHWVCVVDKDGRQLLSVKVANDQAEVEAVIGSVTGKTTWAAGIIEVPSVLLLAVLSRLGQHVRYASRRLALAMSEALAAALHVQEGLLEGLVDGLAAHPHLQIVRELDPQPAGDLDWRPPFDQAPLTWPADLEQAA